MTTSQIFFIALCIVVPAACMIAYGRSQRPEEQRAKLYRDWDARFGHLGVGDQLRTHKQLMKFARLRRLVSDAVILDPGKYREIVDRVAMDEAERDPILAKEFLTVVGESSVGDILYDDAFRALLRHAREQAARTSWPEDEDMFSGMRVS